MDTIGTMDAIPQLREAAEAATAAHAAARGAERIQMLAVVMDLRKREVAACKEQRARLESGARLECDPPAGSYGWILDASIAAAGAASAWLLVAQEESADPPQVAVCRDRAPGWLAEAEYHCMEALFHDHALAHSPAALAARDAILSVRAGLGE
jgi:hypothetical protein